MHSTYNIVKKGGITVYFFIDTLKKAYLNIVSFNIYLYEFICQLIWLHCPLIK